MLNIIFGIIAIFIGFFFGLAVFCNSIFSLFYSVPKLLKLRSEGKLSEKLSVLTIFRKCTTPAVIWLIILIFVESLVKAYLNPYNGYFLFGIGISLVYVIRSLICNRESLTEDFVKVWGEYLR